MTDGVLEDLEDSDCRQKSRKATSQSYEAE